MGATVGRAPELLHGKTSQVHHDGTGVLAGCPQPFTATRYHSLTIDPATVPDELVPNGHTASGIVMAVRHATLPLHGVQFHPESVLTEGGHRMLANWLAVAGMADAVERSAGLSPLVHDAAGRGPDGRRRLTRRSRARGRARRRQGDGDGLPLGLGDPVGDSVGVGRHGRRR